MKKSLFTLMITLSLATTSTFALEKRAPQTQPNCKTRQCQGLQEDFNLIVKNGDDIYCYWKLKNKETKTDFKKEAQLIRDQITDKTTLTEFYWLMRKWAGLFHDGHVNFMLHARGKQVELKYTNIRFDLIAASTPRETLIVSLAPEGTGLKPGDVVNSVGPYTAQEAINLTLATSNGSTDRMRRFFGARRVVEVIAEKDGLAEKINLNITRFDPTGKKPPETWDVQAPIYHMVYPPSPAQSGNSLSVASSMASPLSPYVHYSILPGNIGYLRIDAFSNTGPALREAMRDLNGTQALLIDVRRNGGGDQSGDSVLSRIFSKKINRYSVSPRVSDLLIQRLPAIDRLHKIPFTDFTFWYKSPVLPKLDETYPSKKIAVLIGPNCFSACDTFVSALKSYKAATFFGEGSGGGTGSPLSFRLPYSKHQFRYSIFRGRNHKKRWIEGRGTLPEFRVEETVQSRTLEKDIVVKRAIEYLTQELEIHLTSNEIDVAIQERVLPAQEAFSAKRLSKTPIEEEIEQINLTQTL